MIYGKGDDNSDGNTLSGANVQQADVVLCGGGGLLKGHVSKFPQIRLSNRVLTLPT